MFAPPGRAVRLRLLCHAPTAATRRAAFPLDEPAEPKGLAAAARLALPTPGRVLVSPARSARETAAVLGLAVTVDPVLRDCDWGDWRGRTLGEVAAAGPDAVAAWLADPDAVPHGGESLAALAVRVAAWMDGLSGRVLAVTHPAVVRAAVLHALGAPLACFWRIDAAPLSLVELGRDNARWTLRAGRPVSPEPSPAAGPGTPPC